jgi:hypothetical protein
VLDDLVRVGQATAEERGDELEPRPDGERPRAVPRVRLDVLVFVGEDGIAEDRRFFLVAADGRQYGAPRGPLKAVVPVVDGGRLELRFPDGRTVEGPIELGEAAAGRVTWDGDRPAAGRRVTEPFSAALSESWGRGSSCWSPPSVAGRSTWRRSRCSARGRSRGSSTSWAVLRWARGASA